MIKPTIATIFLVAGFLVFLSGNMFPAMVMGVMALLISLDIKS